MAGAACLVGVAATHATEVAHKLDHAPYAGVLFVLLIAGSLVLAVAPVAGVAPRAAWSLTGALALSAMGAYVSSRTVGMPQMGDHVGHWLEPAGAASLAFEAALVVIAAGAAGARRRAAHARWSGPRRAAAITAAALLVFSAGATAQDAVGPGATGHAHAPGRHDHGGTGGGHEHADFPDLAAAGAADLTEAREILRRVHAAAGTRFADYRDARAAGFDRFRGRGWVRPLVFHMRHAGYSEDERVLDARHPESLVYWWPADGRPQLVGMMFRAPPARVEQGMPALLMWHQHRNERTGELGDSAMTHVWLTTDLQTAFGNGREPS